MDGCIFMDLSKKSHRELQNKKSLKSTFLLSVSISKITVVFFLSELWGKNTQLQENIRIVSCLFYSPQNSPFEGVWLTGIYFLHFYFTKIIFFLQKLHKLNVETLFHIKSNLLCLVSAFRRFNVFSLIRNVFFIAWQHDVWRESAMACWT